MFIESGFDVYFDRMQVVEEQQEDPLQIEAGQRRLKFYATMKQICEQWFEYEAVFWQTGDLTPLNNLIAQVRSAGVQ